MDEVYGPVASNPCIRTFWCNISMASAYFSAYHMKSYKIICTCCAIAPPSIAQRHHTMYC